MIACFASSFASPSPHHHHHHPPWSSVSGTILFRGPSGIILAMLLKKIGLTTNFGHFSKWPPQNLRFPISPKLLHVGSWFWGLNLYLLGQGIFNTLCSKADHYYVCKRTKNMKNIQDGRQFHTLFVLVAIRRWFWCLNLSFQVWGFQ